MLILFIIAAVLFAYAAGLFVGTSQRYIFWNPLEKHIKTYCEKLKESKDQQS